METSIHTEAKPGIGHGGPPIEIAEFDNLPEDAWAGVRTVKALFDNPADSTIWRWIEAEKFPKPEYQDGPGPRRWKVGTLRKVLRGEWRPEDKAA